MTLPDRTELSRYVRRFRIESFEVEDLVQEVYLALLSGDDPEQHLKRLSRRDYYRRGRRRLTRIPPALPVDLLDDDSKVRADGNIDALILMIAVESECDDRELLRLLTAGVEYRDLCQRWRCNYSAAKKRLSRWRRDLWERLEGETD